MTDQANIEDSTAELAPLQYLCHPQGIAFDEVYDGEMGVRPQWQPFLSHFCSSRAERLDQQQRLAQRILRNDGATYDLKNDPLSPAVWSLDIIPNTLDVAQWQTLEAGIKQRSELFNRMLQDIYGEQRLIKEGVIPPEIIFSHPDFLRQCAGIKTPGVKSLILHATDIVRDQNGHFLAIGDQTQAPAGLGFALENRTVISRVHSSLFRHSNVKRLSGFFHTLRHALTSLAAHKTDDPKIVLLTPGSSSRSYFEHTYLANYLGYPLVKGSDLTVRNGKVWLKSIGGLSPVDVILRRTDDDDCDQVELKADSLHGIPGLLEAARSGNVAIANPIGSVVLESPALMAFLPNICQYLLGEPLMLPNVSTYWCGDPAIQDFVENNISSLIIKPAYQRTQGMSVYGHKLDDEEKQAMLAKIRANPSGYVAQYYVPGSMVPVWSHGALESRPSLLKLFSVADGEDYMVMPGGLSRVANTPEDHVVTYSSGARSKDFWVTADSPDATHHSLLESNTCEMVQDANLPSRVVENFFWLGRYIERAEIGIRLMRVIFKQLNGIEILEPQSRQVLLRAISLQTQCLPGFTDDNPALFDDPDGQLADLVINAKCAGSIKANLLALLACAEEVRERLSADTRIILNRLRDSLNRIDRAFMNGLPEAPEESLDELVTSLLALSGLINESMLRGHDWLFLRMGQRTERAIQTTTLLQSTLVTSLPCLSQQQVLESVLLSAEALVSFRRRYRTKAQIPYGLDLLMIDRTNPRALVYQLEKLREYMDKLPTSTTYIPGGLSPECKLVMKTLSDIQLVDLMAISTDNGDKRDALEALLNTIGEQLELFTNLIADKYFDHTEGPQQLIKPKWKLDV